MSLLIWLIANLIGFTWRIRTVDPGAMIPKPDCPKGRIYCFRHAYLLAMAFILRNRRITAIVSNSKDGRIAAGIARRWGHGIISGSSSNGATSAMRQSIRHLKAGQPIAITPDGPRGPAGSVKTGVAQMAITTASPVVIMKIRANRFWQLRSWDKFIIPKPFAEVTILIGDPIMPHSMVAAEDSVETLRKTIENRMADDQ